MKLIVTPAALAELKSATDFYVTNANAALARMLVDEFERAASLLLSNPQLGSLRRTGHCSFGLRRFPYSIIYQLTPDQIRIIALAHQRRRPAYWRGRK